MNGFSDKKTGVSVIMIHYNTYEMTKEAIITLKKFTEGIDYEIIVIDNASPDGSGETIKNDFSGEIKYIQAQENLGTSKAFNRALKEAAGKYVLWLNTDVIFTENFIKKLYDFMEATPDCGVCGGNLVDENMRPSHSFKKKMLSLKTLKKDNNTLRRYFLKPFKKIISDGYNYKNKILKVGCVIGADMMVRSEIFDIIGGFDEDIFMYAEETEFQYRVLKNTGYKIYSVPYAKLIHLGGKSTSSKTFSAKREKLALRGTCIFLSKSYGKEDALKYLKNSERWYRRNVVLATLSFNKQKKSDNTEKIGIAKELLTEFAAADAKGKK